MQRWICLVLVVIITAIGAVEYLTEKTPLEQALIFGKWLSARPGPRRTVIRLGVASWQMREFPWTRTFAAYEKAHPDIHIDATSLPEGAINSVFLLWGSGRTSFDAVVAWSDREIHPFIDYNWTSPDPDRRALIINVRDPRYLSPEKLDSLVPALFGGCSRTDPITGQQSSYEIPWMGEVLALNYNKKFFREAGVLAVPRTWAEIEEVAKKLKGLTHDGRPVAPLALNFDAFFTPNCYVPILAAYKHGRGIADERGHIDVSSPEAVQVFKDLKRWWEAGYISRHALVSGDVEQDLRVMRAAMYPHWQSRGLWAVGDHGPDVIGIAPTPGAEEAGSLVTTYGAIIPRCSPRIPETVQFVYEALCTDTYGFQTGVSIGWIDPETGKLKGGGKMPAQKSLYLRPDMPQGIVELGRGLSRGYSIPDPINGQLCSDIITVEFQKFLSGNTPTAEEAFRIIRERLAAEVYHER